MKKLGILIAVVLFGIFAFAQQLDMETLLNRIELLEEYTNMIYDVLGTKVSSDEFETVLAELDERISELETKVLNIQSTIDTGLPALRDMLYELSANLAALEERITSYVEVSLMSSKEEIKAELMDEILPMLDDIKVTLDIHDSDILKIYDTLGTLSEQIAAVQEKLASFEEISTSIESLTLKLDMHDQDIVNIYDNLSMKADREQVDTLEASVTDLQEQISGLNEILTGLAAQIGDTDYLLRKAIENTQKDLQAKIDTKADAKVVEEKVNVVQEKVNNVNMIAWIGVVLGTVALVLPFVKGQ
ncbi:hypothetical protein QQE94_08980 [Fervidobacterium pennivorans subsp. shakshaketiis]|jgi:chaperonin cofactor prefoldin/ElaB/YqjD/DUF883 family membrane-anchored ribosome-binding protein|uniref:Uncharacterized protein n=1 Tax=Fervidobacterium pennivorans (strain DSM 9078 / Ven5) TaxID=771875 RepID=H9UEM2_FERPD|nr:hypothetical protein [Fervidobacterium pennivorans]AFG35965.1 hypothetical protein Ferpe_1916 [Fervidobacterium pennivorans DSM 9078]